MLLKAVIVLWCSLTVYSKTVKILCEAAQYAVPAKPKLFFLQVLAVSRIGYTY